MSADTHVLVPRPTDDEFAALAAKRDAAIEAVLQAVCEKHGLDPKFTRFHSRDYGAPCYCACPDGPCQHVWDGPEATSDEEDAGFWSSATCSRCKAVAMYHDMRCMP